MNLEEIKQYLSVGRDRSVCVDRRLIDRYPGIVRDVRIAPVSNLIVEFNSFGHSEGGLVFRITFKSLESLVVATETYLRAKIEHWENVTRSGSYPEESQACVDFAESGAILRMDLNNKSIDLPMDWQTCEILPGYWKDVAEGRR